MHNPQECLKIAQDRAALQELYPLSTTTVPPQGLAHDNTVQDCAVLPWKLPNLRIIESLYIAEVRGLQTRVEVQKMYNYRSEVLEYLIFKYPKVETLT
jgi:hypothetical protein